MNEPDYKGFAIAMIDGWPEPWGEGLDGFDMQQLGVKYGMLREETRTTPCCEYCQCSEYHGEGEEVTCYRRCWPAPSEDT